MLKKSLSASQGFTLLETTLVLGLSGLLIVGVFSGQRQLVSRTNFDASVNLIISSVGAARNDAISGVNTSGSAGTGGAKCTGGTNPNPPGPTTSGPYSQYVFAGAEWTVKSTSPYASTQYWKALESSTSSNDVCRFNSPARAYSVVRPVTVNSPAGGARLIYARDSTGNLRVCWLPTAAVNAATTATIGAIFATGTCPGGPGATLPKIITISDTEGHSADIEIDPSGLAHRKVY